MKNKLSALFGILFAFFIVSCSRPISDFRKLEMAYNHDRQNNYRQFSSTLIQGASCLDKNVTVDQIKNEIRALENNSRSTLISGFNGVDLRNFNTSEANFLDKNKEWISSTGINYSDCSNLSCIFGKIYPTSNGLEGLLIYYFYLKMGYMLSVDNKIPSFTPPATAAFNASLFNLDELKYFYFLTKSLGPKFKNISTLKSIHRFYRGYRFTGDLTGACGLAGGYFSKGYIVLQDDCLTPGNNWSLVAITHELSHRLDYTMRPNFNPISESNDWLNMSGWYLKENLNTNTGAVTKREWAVRDNSLSQYDGFVRDYAASSPAEDFADSIGFFRFHNNDLKNKSPKKYEWIMKNIFSRSFDVQNNFNTYLSMASEKLMTKVPTIISSCIKDSSSYQNYNMQNITTDYSEYDKKLVACIFGGLDSSLDSVDQEIMNNEFDACDYLSSNKEIFDSTVLDSIGSLIKKDLANNLEIAKQLEIFANFIKDLNEEVDTKELFINCQEDLIKAKACYEQKIAEKFEEISTNYIVEIPNQIVSFKKDYLERNSYVVTEAKVVSLLNQIFVGVDTKFTKEGNRKFNECFSHLNTYQDNSENVLLTPFDGENRFVHKRLLNCINTNAFDELSKIVNSVSLRYGIKIESKSLMNYITNMNLNNYINAITTNVDEKAEIENNNMNELHSKTVTDTVNTLTTDIAWIASDIFRGAQLTNACIDKATGLVQSTLAQSSFILDGSFIFSTIGNFSEKWPAEICKAVIKDPQILAKVSSNEEFVLQQNLPELSEIVFKYSDPIGVKCKTLFPTNGNLTIKSRNLCLTMPDKWMKIVDQSITEWLASHADLNIADKDKKAKSYLNSKKAELQTQMIARMNK